MSFWGPVDETNVVSGDWSVGEVRQGLDSIARSGGLETRRVTFVQAGNALVAAPPGRMPEDFTVEPAEFGARMIGVEMADTPLEDAVEFLYKTEGKLLEKAELDGRVSIVMQGVPAVQVLDAILQVSGAEVESGEMGDVVTNSKLPSVSNGDEGMCPRTDNPFSETGDAPGAAAEQVPTIRTDVANLKLAGLDRDVGEALLMADSRRGCILRKGDRVLMQPEEGPAELWRVYALSSDSVRLFPLESSRQQV